MKHQPTAEAVRKMAASFKSNDKEKRILNMDVSDIHRRHKGICGTIACHAGHYLAANAHRREAGVKYQRWERVDPNTEILIDIDSGDHATYQAGIKLMAKDLGFRERLLNAIQNWAYHNPKIWGNANGVTMFDDDRAFDKLLHQTTLADIHDHWMGVADRLEEWERFSS